MSKPLIGIAPDFKQGSRAAGGYSEPTLFVRSRYVAAIEAAGGIPIVLPIIAHPALCASLLDRLSGLLLTGSGPDIDPRRYGERKRFSFPIMTRERTDSEFALVKESRKRDLPVLGICGGMQLMNVALGGTLVQDIGRQIAGALPHRVNAPATEVSHTVAIRPGTRLWGILGRRTLQVNSSHHQAVKAVPSTLAVSAVAPDGVIEALEDATRRFFIGVQWHPEYLYQRHAAHRTLFEAFIEAAASLSSPIRRVSRAGA